MSTVDLAVIGNGVFGALVDRRGRFVWCCMESFNGDPVFNCLLNNNSDKTGFYDVVLEDFERCEQTYLGTSAVLVTTLHSSRGDSVEIRDFAPRFVHYDRIFRPFQLFRTIKRLKGDPRVTIRIRPTFQYNSTDGYQTRGSQHVRFCGPQQTWRATTNTSVRHVLEEMPFLLPIEPVYIVFGTDESFANSLRNVANEFEVKTVLYWKTWCNSMCLPVEYQEVLVRAAMTISMMQSEDSGGLLSALTLGLPLGPFSTATRDARGCRLLDECIALPVLRDTGLFDVCRKFLLFAKEVCFHQEKPQHTYSPWGSSLCQSKEWEPYLAGYRGMGEVHSGGMYPGLPNEDCSGRAESGASGGEDPGGGAGDCGGDELSSRTVINSLLVVALAHAFFDIRLSEELCTPKLFEKLEFYASQACHNFECVLQSYLTWRKAPGPSTRRPRRSAGAAFFDDEPDFFAARQRGRAESEQDDAEEGATTQRQPSVHCLSSVLCWAAADRLHRISLHFHGDHTKAEYWRRRASQMHEDICQHGWSSTRGAFTSYWGWDHVGPSVLRLAELGFISAQDVRFSETLRGFETDALCHAVCFGSDSDSAAGPRSVTSPRAGVSEDEAVKTQSACFLTNTLLWYCEALRSTRSPVESRRLLESLLRCSTHRGLLPESVDLRTMELWGNAPSVSSLLSLLRVASRLSRSWRDV